MCVCVRGGEGGNVGKGCATDSRPSKNRAAGVVTSSSYDHRRSVEILNELGWDNLDTKDKTISHNNI